METKQSAAHFNGFSKVKNLYITGHSNGAVNFWDVSSPSFIPIFSLKQQVIPYCEGTLGDIQNINIFNLVKFL